MNNILEKKYYQDIEYYELTGDFKRAARLKKEMADIKDSEDCKVFQNKITTFRLIITKFGLPLRSYSLI